jgi:methionyl-tRNA formyltransferase
MRVVLFAWCRTARVYFDALADSGAAPALVVSGERAPARAALDAACAATGTAVTDDERAPGFVERLAALEPDLIAVTGWPRKLGTRVTALARLGAVNFHPSLLPLHRGRDPLFWSVLAGEPEVGVSVHHLTEELDAGPVLWQTRLRVPDGATSASLAELCDRAGARLVPELVRAARRGRLPPGSAQSGAGSYDPPASDADARLDFSRDALWLERLVRAADGVVRAHAWFRGMKAIILSAQAVRFGHSAPPGTVLAVDPRGLSVAAARASEGPDALCVTRLVFVEREHSAEELAARLGVEPGARLE